MDEPIPTEEEGLQVNTGRGPAHMANAPETASFTGAMLGSYPSVRFPGMPAPMRAGMVGVGAGGGYLAGRTIQDLANDVPFSLDRIAENVIDATKQGLMAGSAEMILPFGGLVASAKLGGLSVKGGVEYAVGKAASKAGEYILPVTGTAVQRAEEIVKKGGSVGGLTPGQMTGGAETGHRVLDIMTNLTYHAWTGGPTRGAYQANEQAAQAALDNFVTNLTRLAPKDAEETFKAVLDGRMQQYMMLPAKRAFDSIRTRAPGNVVELTPLIKTLRDPDSKIGNLVIDSLQKVREVIPQDTQEIDDLIGLLKTPARGTQTQALPKLTINQAMYLKSALGRVSDRTSYAGTPEGDLMISAAGRLNTQVDTQTRAALTRQQQLSGDQRLLADYDKANKFYAAAAEKFRGPLIENVLKQIEKKPGALARLLMPETIASEQEHLNIINAVKAAYGPRWNLEMIPLLSATLAGRAYNNVTKTYDGHALAREVGKYGKTLLDTMLGPKRGEQLMDFAHTLNMVGERPKGLGSMLIQMSTAGAVGAASGYAVTGDFEKAAGTGIATVTVAPYVLGQLLHNPRWLHAMKTGLYEFSKTGKPPGMLMTTLRQAAVAAQGTPPAKHLEVEPNKREVISETKLPRTLTPEISTAAPGRQ